MKITKDYLIITPFYITELTLEEFEYKELKNKHDWLEIVEAFIDDTK